MHGLSVMVVIRVAVHAIQTLPDYFEVLCVNRFTDHSSSSIKAVYRVTSKLLYRVFTCLLKATMPCFHFEDYVFNDISRPVKLSFSHCLIKIKGCSAIQEQGGLENSHNCLLVLLRVTTVLLQIQVAYHFKPSCSKVLKG